MLRWTYSHGTHEDLYVDPQDHENGSQKTTIEKHLVSSAIVIYHSITAFFKFQRDDYR